MLFPNLGQEALGFGAVAPPPADKPAPAPEIAPAASAGLDGLLHLPLLAGRDAVVEQSRTAEAIGVSRQYLHRLIDKYNLRIGERF
jgi:hypothetical protein